LQNLAAPLQNTLQEDGHGMC